MTNPAPQPDEFQAEVQWALIQRALKAEAEAARFRKALAEIAIAAHFSGDFAKPRCRSIALRALWGPDREVAE